jgi:glutathione synthase/RimK-type ligase-like ATP-grasp enzyme
MNVFLRRKGLGYETTKLISKILREKYNQNIKVLRSDNINMGEPYETVIRWGCTSTIPKERIINFAKHVHLQCDKVNFRRLLQNNNISTPKTFFSKQDILNLENAPYPLIGRPRLHSQGRYLVIINNEEDLFSDSTSSYWSEYIEKDREFRVYTFFGRIIKVDEKVPTEKGKTEVAWNHHQGNSKFKNVRWGSWSLASCLEALKVLKYIPIHFNGIDVIEKNGIPYILEANSAPTMTGNYDTNLFADGFNWMLNKIKETGNTPELFPIPEEVNSWKDLIHPIKL